MIWLSGFLTLPAQKEGNVWFLGDSLFLDFNTLPPTVSKTANLSSTEAAASVCDSTGALLFYSNNGTVFNRLADTIDNFSISTTAYGEMSITNGVMFLPHPCNDNLYFLFQIAHDPLWSNTNNYLKVSLIDKTLDSGLGGIGTLKDSALYFFSFYTEKLTAVRHANGRDWWIITHEYGNNEFVIFRLGCAGISGPMIQAIGQSHIGLGSTAIPGEIVASEQGDKLVNVSHNGMIDLFAFDRCNGVLSDWVEVQTGVSGIPSLPRYGCSFSPSGTRLYSSGGLSAFTSIELVQYDLTSTDIPASKVAIWTPDTSMIESFGHHQLGQDGKIYISVCHGIIPPSGYDAKNQYLAIIEDPDSAGLACNFIPRGLYVGPGRLTASLPNIPAYSLGPLAAMVANAGPDITICEGDTVTLGSAIIPPAGIIVQWNAITGSGTWIEDAAAAQTRAVPDSSGWFYFTVTDTNMGIPCGQSVDSLFITVIPGSQLPDAHAGNDTTICFRQSITLGTPDTSGGRYAFSWLPETFLSNPSSPQPVFFGDSSTSYILTVTDTLLGVACAVATDTITLTVEVCDTFFVPDVFTPNGDGINDYFVVTGVEKKLHLSIFDRWGKLVFTSDDYLNTWDGRTAQGSPLPEGVYFYELHAQMVVRSNQVGEPQKSKAGVVTLMR